MVAQLVTLCIGLIAFVLWSSLPQLIDWYDGYMARQQRAAWIAELDALYEQDRFNALREAQLVGLIEAFDRAAP